MFGSKTRKFLICLPQQILTARFQSFASSFLPKRPSINQAKQSHARIIVSGLADDPRLIGHLLAFLALSPSTPFHYSLSLYKSITSPTVFATNNMLRCFAKSECPSDAVLLYSSMLRNYLKPNKHTFTFMLQACRNALAINEGTQVQTHVIKLAFDDDLFVRNALIHFYCASFRIGCAKRVFDEFRHCRDVVTWNSMLVGFVRVGQMGDAEKMFGEIPEKDVISWSTMIMGYVQNGWLEKGISYFKAMREKGLRPNEAILVSVLSASAQLGLLEHGRLVHSIAESLKLPMTASLGTALVDMYAKCGCIEQAKFLFDSMPQRDSWTWNVMICGLASHGLGKEALSLFEKAFVNDGKFHPASVTFIGVLNACSKAGLVSEGRHYFKLMTDNYGIEPEMEHYGCMVDLLSRAGLIHEAVELIEKMPGTADPVLWGTLLDSCKIHGLVELGEKIGNKLIQMDPTHDGHYVQLASIYAKLNKWEDVTRVWRLKAAQNSNKVAGWSFIEEQGRAH